MMRINFPFVSLHSIKVAGKQGASANLKTYSVAQAVTAGNITTAFTNIITAGWYVWGVTVKNVTLLTAVTGVSYIVGHLAQAACTNLWGNALGLTSTVSTTGANFLTVSTLDQLPKIFTANTTVNCTLNTGTWSTGTIRMTVHYVDFTGSVY